jgi:hypothetical protein
MEHGSRPVLTGAPLLPIDPVPVDISARPLWRPRRPAQPFATVPRPPIVEQAKQKLPAIKAEEAAALAARDAAKREAAQAQSDLEKARADLLAFKRSVGAVA